jgi:hypothetical protein
MENTVIAQHQDVRRRLGGPIDIDFYRQRGLMERRTVMTGFAKGLGKKSLGKLGKPLAAALVTVALLYAIAPRDGTAGVNSAPTHSNVTR